MPRTEPPLPALNLDGWFRECKRAGLETDTERARHVGVTRETINRLQGGRPVSAAFIGAALTAFPLARFEDLFTIRPAAAERAA